MRMLGLVLGIIPIGLSALLLSVLAVGIAASGRPTAIFRLSVVGVALQSGPALIALVPGGASWFGFRNAAGPKFC